MEIPETLKKHKIKAGLLILFIPLFIFGIAPASKLFYPYQLLNPFKVIDPANPRFDPMKFRLEDYITREAKISLVDAVQAICKQAESEKFFDEAFVKSARMRKNVSNRDTALATYWYDPWYIKIDDHRYFYWIQVFKSSQDENFKCWLGSHAVLM